MIPSTPRRDNNGQRTRTLDPKLISLLVPRSPPGQQELPHLLDQESEGLWYIFAVAFRLLGVRWPWSPSSAGAGGAATAAAATGGTDGGDVSLRLWPERRSFEPETAAAPDDTLGGGAGGHHRQINRQQQQQHQHQHQGHRRLRPPRPGSAEAGDAGGTAVGRLARSGSEGGGGGGAGSGGAKRTGTQGPMLVVDDLLEWSGEGDEGPAGGGGGGAGDWDGTALGLEFLRREGSALLRRYFAADGEVQRARWVFSV